MAKWFLHIFWLFGIFCSWVMILSYHNLQCIPKTCCINPELTRLKLATTYKVAFPRISRLNARIIMKAFNETDFYGKMKGYDRRSMLVQLSDAITRITSLSRIKFSAGLTESSNPKSQMGTWMDNEDLVSIEKVLNDTALSASSSAKCLLDTKHPLVIDLLQPNSIFSLKLFHSPSYLSNLAPRRHPSGTIILYKGLYGTGQLESSIGSRVIQKETLKGSLNGTMVSGTMLMRIGGPLRTFRWQPSVHQSIGLYDIDNANFPAGYLELALFPPANAGYGNSDGDEGIDQAINEEASLYNSSADSLEANMPFPSHEVDKLLDSFRQQSQEQNSIGAEEAKRRKLTNGSDLTGAIKDEDGNSIEIDYRSIRLALNRRIGGLGPQLDDIIRRLLASRRLRPETLQALGLSHVRGILLYGPPGTGKTLIAREIARVLRAREPKIVNGPEIMDKFVGEAERNVRELFREADEEWDRMGYRSQLHVIVLDELDSIAKKRGSMLGGGGDGAGVRDSVVNQLLSKIDGVQERNNVIVIGMTNRRDLIDPALLRPGRLEVQVEIQPPDREGRREILSIMMKPMVQSGFLSLKDGARWAGEISFRTAGWSGADLGGLMRSASSFAIERAIADEDIQLIWSDFEMAFKDMRASKRVSRRSILKEVLLRICSNHKDRKNTSIFDTFSDDLIE